MTDAHVARLLTDLIHIFTRMETTMAVNFDALNAAVADLEAKVVALSSVPSQPAAVDEAAIQATLDATTARVTAAMATFNADLARLLNAPPAPTA